MCKICSNFAADFGKDEKNSYFFVCRDDGFVLRQGA